MSPGFKEKQVASNLTWYFRDVRFGEGTCHESNIDLAPYYLDVWGEAFCSSSDFANEGPGFSHHTCL
jgi:hypothetical protein